MAKYIFIASILFALFAASAAEVTTEVTVDGFENASQNDADIENIADIARASKKAKKVCRSITKTKKAKGKCTKKKCKKCCVGKKCVTKCKGKSVSCKK